MPNQDNEKSFPKNSGSALIHTMEDDLKGSAEIKFSQQEKIEKPIFTSPSRPAVPASPFPPSIPPASEKRDNTSMDFTDSYKRGGETNKPYSPFLNTYASKEAPKKDDEQLLEQPIKGSSGWKKVVVGLTIIIIILALAGGGYYFWVTRQTSEVPPDVSLVTEEETTAEEAGEPVSIEPQTRKYTFDKPNYFTIDTETATKQKIQADIGAVASKLKNLNPSAPVEFIVVDENNNPIAFPIFSILTDINLGPALDFLEERFSLYFYNDMGKMRLAITAEVKDKAKAEEAMTAKEKTLINDVSFLFLDDSAQNKKIEFKTGTAKKYPVRYANLDDTGGLFSVDYSFTDKDLIISTSKNTTWVLIDKLSP